MAGAGEVSRGKHYRNPSPGIRSQSGFAGALDADGALLPSLRQPRPSMQRILSSSGGAENHCQQAGHVLVAFGFGRPVPTSDDAPGTPTVLCWTRSSEPEAEGVSALLTSRADRHPRSTIYPGFLAKPRPNQQNTRNAAIHETGMTPNQLAFVRVSPGRGSGSFRRFVSVHQSQAQLDPFPPSPCIVVFTVRCFKVR